MSCLLSFGDISEVEIVLIWKEQFSRRLCKIYH
jgi:hypothetical protein